MTTPLHALIHGHFYQPPRENPWLEELERDDSAAPHHDWNARITEECYAPNTGARILDEQGRVVRVFDNFAWMSFNVGPTLTSWLQRHHPATLEAIVAADAASVARLGEGNAIAQAYNHMILPLANDRDKRTQVRWGQAAFTATFGRRARGMWLAETAVDAATLDVLAEEGIDFTVLSPLQAARFRVDGHGDEMRDCHDGSIPTGRAYRYTTPSGKTIALFFYDAGIAKGIAFQGLLADANNLVGAVRGAHDGRPDHDEPWLVHTATDGESYGHHFASGDMALAAAHARLADADDVEIINYAVFLDRYGTHGDVEIKDVSSWSCAHGVGRWMRDCGCRMQHNPPWSQGWRGPLRMALDGLRDTLAGLFHDVGATYLRDPWAARDAYIDVVLDRSRTAAFLDAQLADGVDEAGREKALRLLEMQRCCMLMYTSCGWFFDDVSGPEGVIILRYAARAISLARGVDPVLADAAEQQLREVLTGAHSNFQRDGRSRTGRDVYDDDAVTAAMGADRIAATVALTAGTGASTPMRIAAWRVCEHDERAVEGATVATTVGRLEVFDERMGERERVAYAVVDFGGLDWRGVLTDVTRHDALAQALSAARESTALARVLEEEVAAGGRAFTLKEAAWELRGEITRKALARRMEITESVIAELLLADRALLRGAAAMGHDFGGALRPLLGQALTRRAREAVDAVLRAEGSLAPLARQLAVVIDDARELAV
ncbi:MAG TPA: DUF3536 domain-containing protein, partial [Myxococcota bacterium]